MKKKIFALFSAAIILTSSWATGVNFMHADATVADTAVIGVDEPFNNVNILTMTEQNGATNMILNMVYDTLFVVGEGGELDYGLIERVEYTDNWSGGTYDLEFPEQAYLPNGEVDTLGWNFIDIPESVSIYNSDAEGPYYKLKEDIYFQSGTPFTVDSLINMIAFANAQPTNTLIYKVWSPITINRIDDRWFTWSFDYDDLSFGYMDILYALASPIGGIFDVGMTSNNLPSSTPPFGTGPYVFDNVYDTYVTMSTSDWWWGEDVLTQNVRFEYYNDASAIAGAIQSETVSVGVFNKTLSYASYRESDLYEDFIAGDYVEDEFEGNPFGLYFNLDEESLFNSLDLRLATTYALDKEDIRREGYLNVLGNGIWCYFEDEKDYFRINMTNEEPSQAAELTIARGMVQSYEEENYVLDGVSSITLVAQNGSSFSNGAEYVQMVSAVENDIEALFQAYNISVNVVYATKQQISTYEQNGNYDIILREIDLKNYNSAYQSLYGKITSTIYADESLEYALNAIDAPSFAALHLCAQWWNLVEPAVVNLGWQSKILLRRNNVDGITTMQKFCSTGSDGRIDFRYISVTS